MQEDLRVKNTHCWTHGYHFLKWGLWFFIFGIILGLGVLIHYLVGSAYNNSGEFLSNITLWFGSPLTLSAGYLQLGGLGMAILGLAYLLLTRYYSDLRNGDLRNPVDSRNPADARNLADSRNTVDGTACPTHNRMALNWCIFGLIALFLTGFIGYFVIDHFWPGFYYFPNQYGKNLWLILQGLSLLCYLIGFVIATACLCKCKRDHQVKANVKV